LFNKWEFPSLIEHGYVYVFHGLNNPDDQLL